MTLIISACDAYSSDPFTKEPQLRVELGMHASQIDRISVSRDHTLMVTGSYDKTARLWELPRAADKGDAKPRLLRTFRPPINPDSFDGMVYAVAMHPDGNLVAVSGYTPSAKKGRWSVYIFNTRSGQILDTIDDNPYRVAHLVFSKCGNYLAATMKSGFGMRVWKTGNWKEPIAKDNEGYGQSYGAAFDDKGRLYTTAYNTDPNKSGHLRRYSTDTFKLESKVEIPGALEVGQVAIQPHGDLVAVGSMTKPDVYLYQATERSLTYFHKASTEGLRKHEHVGKISWSGDGEYLVGGGTYEKGGVYQFRVWKDKGQGKPRDFDGPMWFITDLMPFGDHIAFCAREPAFGVIDTNGNRKIWQSRAAVNMLEKQFGDLKVSEDGFRISFGLGVGGKSPFIFDVIKFKTDVAEENINDLYPADYTSLSITNWNRQRYTSWDNPLFNGRPIAGMLTPLPSGEVKEERHRFGNEEEWTSLAIAPDKKHFVLGTEWRLRGYSVENVQRPLWINKHIPGKVWAVNIARNGKLLIAAYDDGTIRWHRTSDGKELLALLVQPDAYRRWIAWTPKGYFAGSIGAEDLIGWHVNRGPDKAALFYPVYHFREKYYNENIIKRVLITLDENRAIRDEEVRLAKEHRSKKEYEEVSSTPPPYVEIRAPEHNHKFTDPEQVIEYVVRVASSSRIPTKLEVLVDGIHDQTRDLEDADVDRTLRVRVVLPKKDSEVTLIALSGNVRGRDQSISFKWGGPTSTVPDKPKLLGLAVGISDYDKSRLEFADKDAADFAAALKKQEGRLFSQVDIDVLGNAKANKDHIITALQKLSTKVKFSPPDTITAIFYSGHGATSKGRFYLLPVESTEESYIKNGISQDDLYFLLNDIRGRKIIFFDACWSNAVLSGMRSDIPGFLNDMRRRGLLSAFVYSATDRGQASIALECRDQEHGCFTKALLEALEEGKADQYTPFDVTDTYELHVYLARRVAQLSNNAQRPNMLAIDKGLTHINVAK